ncbi:MAG: phosphoribosylformylglycinamidine cyclo-ligase [Pontiellaceae bacterium]
MSNAKKSAYAKAGVNIDAMMDSLNRIKHNVKKTNTSGVLSQIGSFGGLFKSPGKDNVLVSSIDGVGTKLMIANQANQHNTVGQDLVNHCVNDILVQGATPLFFLDYLGTSSLDPKVFENVVNGFCKACRQNNMTLLGGETAEMPGLYPKGEYDLVGTVIGTVERKKLITGKKIRQNDIILGLPSTGLQTNGYSLARKVIFDDAEMELSDLIPNTKTTFKKGLLAIHKSYLHPIKELMNKINIHGMAHITGGGLYDNIPRILPDNLNATIDSKSWKIPALFNFIQESGSIDFDEMYRVFNMGIGYIIIISPNDIEKALKILKMNKQRSIIIGKITKGNKKTIIN